MMHNRSLLLLPLALAMGILFFLGTRASGQSTTQAVTEVVQTATAEPTSGKTDAAPGSATEIRDYGRRQSQSPELCEFAGGHDDDIIIISTCSGGLLIAILVLVILL